MVVLSVILYRVLWRRGLLLRSVRRVRASALTTKGQENWGLQPLRPLVREVMH